MKDHIESRSRIAASVGQAARLPLKAACPYTKETHVLGNIITWCVFGLIAGALARLLTPGADRLGCLGTIGLGMLGSVVGGYLGALIHGREALNAVRPAGLLGSVIGGIVVLLIVRAVRPPAI
jgi:uncharacterized membrane protein YeaQ/YmgE (transglycosylase-associated protein family)